MAQFHALVDTSYRVTASAGRLAKVNILAEYVRTLASDEIDVAVHYLSGEIPQGRIGLGYALLKKMASRRAAVAVELEIQDVDRCLIALAAVRGNGSGKRRESLLGELFMRATPAEHDFLLRLLTGELRQGAQAGVMLDAIAVAAGLPATQIRRAAMYSKNLGAVAHAVLTAGAEALSAFRLEPFAPVSPMLAQTAADVVDALEQLPGGVALEWKMDGARIQAHKVADEVRIYTRNANEVGAAVPEIVAAVRALPIDTVILDGEAIVVDESGRPRAFQITMRRFGRKLDVESLRDELPIKAFFFDCLRLGTDSIADSPLRDRIGALAAAVPTAMRMPRLLSPSLPDAHAFYAAALAAGHEGIMAKAMDSPYEAGNRGSSWLKIKHVHTLDLLVLAAEWGHGRRAGKLSNLHLGVLDPASGEYVMLGKTFKGLTDALLEWQTAELLAREVRRDPGTVYVRPELVVEIAFSDLQASIRYPGGLALRLARVKRYRPDKRSGDADTMDTVRRLHASQRSETLSAGPRSDD